MLLFCMLKPYMMSFNCKSFLVFCQLIVDHCHDIITHCSIICLCQPPELVLLLWSDSYLNAFCFHFFTSCFLFAFYHKINRIERNTKGIPKDTNKHRNPAKKAASILPPLLERTWLIQLFHNISRRSFFEIPYASLLNMLRFPLF